MKVEIRRISVRYQQFVGDQPEKNEIRILRSRPWDPFTGIVTTTSRGWRQGKETLGQTNPDYYSLPSTPLMVGTVDSTVVGWLWWLSVLTKTVRKTRYL